MRVKLNLFVALFELKTVGMRNIDRKVKIVSYCLTLTLDFLYVCKNCFSNISSTLTLVLDHYESLCSGLLVGKLFLTVLPVFLKTRETTVITLVTLSLLSQKMFFLKRYHICATLNNCNDPAI